MHCTIAFTPPELDGRRCFSALFDLVMYLQVVVTLVLFILRPLTAAQMLLNLLASVAGISCLIILSAPPPVYRRWGTQTM